MPGAQSVELNLARCSVFFARCGGFAALASLLVAFLSQSAPAQGVLVMASPAAMTSENQPFVLPTLSNEIIEAIQDYRRYIQRSQWEKAFKQLEKLSSAQAKGLLPDKDGVLVPPNNFWLELHKALGTAVLGPHRDDCGSAREAV